jgi:hypothetical protein
MFFKKEKKVETPSTKYPRIDRLSDPDLLSWFDTALVDLCRGFDQWRYKDAPSYLVQEQLSVLTAMWDEIQSRSRK